MTKAVLFSLGSTWLPSWHLAVIEISSHWINKYTVKMTSTKNIGSRKQQNIEDLDLLFIEEKI
jgi:hypothetical protein